MDDAAVKWDERYAQRHWQDTRPIGLLDDFAHLLPTTGKALEVACGLGANARFLARHGLETQAWDISPVAVDNVQQSAAQLGLNLHAQVRDCVSQPPTPQSFDVIVVSYFLERSLFNALLNALKPGGLLFYQTFITETTEANGPKNPLFRLQPNELLNLTLHSPQQPRLPLRLVYYREEGLLGDLEQGFRNEAQMILAMLSE